MKLVAPIYQVEELKAVAPYVDAVLLMVPHNSYLFDPDFPLEKAIKEAKSLHLEVILSVSRIFMEDELDRVKSWIDAHQEEMFYVSDLGLVQYLISIGKADHVIYDPSTLVCNHLDLSFYQSLKLKAIGVSNEIPLTDVLSAYEKTHAPLFYQVFGRRMMFYSKRPLLDCYQDYRQLSFKKDQLTLMEEKRDYHIPIFTNENGTYIYRHYHLSLLKEVQRLDAVLMYAYLESLTLDKEDYLTVLSLFKAAKDKKSPLSELENQFAALHIKAEDGFTYSDSIHNKEKIIHEKEKD